MHPQLVGPSGTRHKSDKDLTARVCGTDFVRGITIACGGFYGPQGRVVRQNLAMPNMLEDIESFEFGGFRITNFEMESSALAGMSAKLGHNAGTVCFAIAHRYHKAANTGYKNGMAELLQLCLERLTA